MIFTPFRSLIAPNKSPCPSNQNLSANLSKSRTELTSAPPKRLNGPTIHFLSGRRNSSVSVSSCPIPNRSSLHRSSPNFDFNLPVPGSVTRRSSVIGSLPTHKAAANFASAAHGIEVSLPQIRFQVSKLTNSFSNFTGF